MRKVTLNLSCNCSRAGASTVEFALVLPVLFACVLGLIELSYIYQAHNVINSAVSRAARIGVAQHRTNEDVVNEIDRLLTTFLESGEYQVEILDAGSIDANGTFDPAAATATDLSLTSTRRPFAARAPPIPEY